MRKKPSYVRKLLAKMPPEQQLQKIVDHGMCIGCGACQSIAGADHVEMLPDKDGNLVPSVKGSIDEQAINQILSVCPGTKIEGLPEALVEKDSAYDEVWGIWRKMCMAFAADKQTRFQGSTGGLLTALAQYLVQSHRVTFVLHARASSTSAAYGEYTISRTEDQILEAAGSRYGPTPTLINILRILDHCDQTGETFAFVGTPCDVTALRNLAQEDPRVEQYCQFQLAMVCGGFMKPAGLNNVLRKMGMNPEDINSLRYRGYGCPGPTRIELKNQEVRDLDYLDFWGEDDSGWDLPHRCKVCPDGIGDAADIAAADAWEGGAPDRLAQHTDPGTNSAIVRTVAGEELLTAAVNAGYVTVEAEITPRDMDRFQPHQVKKKRAVWSRFVGMRAANSVVPDVRGLRLKPLARSNSVAENLREARGAKERAEKLSKP